MNHAPYASLLVKDLKVIPLLLAAISSNRRHIDHALSELDECPPLDRNIQVSNVMEDEIDKSFDGSLAQLLFQALYC